jgi:uncharacterized protein YndB with AHSA1/START domain
VSTQAIVAPVRKSVTVDRPVAEAFRLFTDEMATWWPLRSHSVNEESTETVVFEPRAGGRVYERRRDGPISYWAEVTVWEPPRRFVLAWRPNPDAPAATELEITFTPEGGRTRVDLEHRGWERLGEIAELKRTEYEAGWEGLLNLYAGRSGDNGLAIASLVLGIASLVVPFVGIIGAPLGIVFGALARRRARGGARHGGIATAGIAVSAVAFVVWVGFGLLAVLLFGLGSGEQGVETGPIVPLEETPAP